MGTNLQQTISLQTKLSPQQIQMIKLLELPTMQLEQRIKREIEENIVLEEEQPVDEEREPEKISVEEYIGKEDDTPSYKARINNFSKDDKQRPVYITEGRSLQEYLIEQLRFRSLSDLDMAVAVYIVGSIDDDGYLRRDLSSLSDDMAFSQGIDVDVEHIERILSIIHQLEPAGVGARNLQECLLLQMRQIRIDTRAKRLALKILTSYFEAFAKKHYERLMARLQISEDEFRDAIEQIKCLYPKPGNLYTEGGSDTTPYIVPDFVLDNTDGELRLTLNSSNIPEVRISRRYKDMIRDMVAPDGTVKEKDREAIQFVKSKIDSAKWFISAIKQRHDTLMRTMRTILDFQRDYFIDGDKIKLR
ncbi:MAG: RNA polymerase sigma-54 factor, partial [Alistipes sp.]|nr:RNA polymerase sigma-54 factor [Alistipes sp.]